MMLFNPLGEREITCCVDQTTVSLISRDFHPPVANDFREPFQIVVATSAGDSGERRSLDVSLSALQGIFAVLLASRIAVPDIHTFAAVRDIPLSTKTDGPMG